MRQVVNLATLCVGAVLLALTLPAAEVSAATAPVTMTQVIRPLTCMVDVVIDGPTKSIRLSPAQCSRLPEAREFLRDTRATFEAQ